MPRSMILEHESRRLGELWRSQGEAFLIEQAEILIADVDRLRASYMALQKVTKVAAPAPAKGKAVSEEKVIDLRDNSLEGVYCSRRGHTFDKAVARCARCRNAFCVDDIVRPDFLRGDALCQECALVRAGVNHKRGRSLARRR